MLRTPRWTRRPPIADEAGYDPEPRALQAVTAATRERRPVAPIAEREKGALEGVDAPRRLLTARSQPGAVARAGARSLHAIDGASVCARHAAHATHSATHVAFLWCVRTKSQSWRCALCQCCVSSTRVNSAPLAQLALLLSRVLQAGGGGAVLCCVLLCCVLLQARAEGACFYVCLALLLCSNAGVSTCGCSGLPRGVQNLCLCLRRPSMSASCCCYDCDRSVSCDEPAECASARVMLLGSGCGWEALHGTCRHYIYSLFANSTSIRFSLI